MRKINCLFLTMVLALGFGLVSSSAIYAACQNTVKFAEATWESADFYTALAKKIVENAFGCKSEIVTGSKSVTEAALISGDIDIWMEQWEGQNAATAKAAQENKISLVGDLLDGGTIEGWFVPRYVVEGDAKRGIKAIAPGLKSISDLPKYKAIFKDAESPDKGRFLNCPTGWTCEKTNGQLIKAYGLQKFFTNFKPGTGGAMNAEISSAVKTGRPILFYYWAPSAIISQFDLYKLIDTPYNEKCWKTVFNTDTDEACPSGYPQSKLVVAVAKNFNSSQKEIVSFLSKLKLSHEMLNKYMKGLADKTENSDQEALKFLKNEESTWKKWLTADEAKILKSKI